MTVEKIGWNLEIYVYVMLLIAKSVAFLKYTFNLQDGEDRYFNNLCEGYCAANNIDPATLSSQNRSENQAQFAVEEELTPHKYPRSKAPVEGMIRYTANELRPIIPGNRLDEFHAKREQFYVCRSEEMLESTPYKLWVRTFSVFYKRTKC